MLLSRRRGRGFGYPRVSSGRRSPSADSKGGSSVFDVPASRDTGSSSFTGLSFLGIGNHLFAHRQTVVIPIRRPSHCRLERRSSSHRRSTKTAEFALRSIFQHVRDERAQAGSMVGRHGRRVPNHPRAPRKLAISPFSIGRWQRS